MNRRRVQFELSLIEFIYNGCFSAANFLSVFLESIGIPAGTMGLISACISGIGIVSQPTWGVISDRVRSVKRCFILCMLGTALCVLFVPALSRGTGLWLAAMVAMLMLMYFFFHPANLMMELWLVRVNNNPALQIPYGSVRSWASIGYAFFSLLFVPILRVMPVRNVYYFLAVFALVSGLLSLQVPRESEGENTQKPRQRLRDMPFRSILSYWIVGHIIFEVLYQIPFGWRVNYMVFAMKEFQVETTLYGAILFLSGICEVPMLLLIKRFSHRTGWAWPLLISAALLSMEYSLYAFGHSVFILFAAQLLRGFSYALYVACRTQYMNRLAPEGLEASTQALVNAVTATVGFFATASGGFLMEALGVRPFFGLLTGLQLVSAVFFAALHLVGSRLLGLRPRDPQCTLFGGGQLR